ncbi:MAG: Zn-ribbon domain-containing OB-fold protein [Deltaproteobacteria bacterium]|nr:Zn-ribbon domain-containing OB-fold protein [Deltaproteobacteria bacterium]
MIKKTDEQISIPMVVDVPFEFAAGQYLTRALTELRDNGRFYGVKCPKCGRVQLPPRIVCAECLVRNEEWVELGLEGTLKAFTIMYLPLNDPTTGKPHNPPFVYGSVQLDEATSVLDHLVNIEPDMDKIWVGMRCRIVLRPQEERIGDLSDILYFQPLPGQKKPEQN